MALGMASGDAGPTLRPRSAIAATARQFKWVMDQFDEPGGARVYLYSSPLFFVPFGGPWWFNIHSPNHESLGSRKSTSGVADEDSPPEGSAGLERISGRCGCVGVPTRMGETLHATGFRRPEAVSEYAVRL